MDSLANIFDNNNLDGILISNSYNVKYVSGYSADYCFVLITKNNKYFFTDGRFTIEAKRDLEKDWTVIEISSSKDFKVS